MRCTERAVAPPLSPKDRELTLIQEQPTPPPPPFSSPLIHKLTLTLTLSGAASQGVFLQICGLLRAESGNAQCTHIVQVPGCPSRLVIFRLGLLHCSKTHADVSLQMTTYTS